MGRCVSIYECDYLLDILSSKSLTRQSITFLKMSQCDPGRFTRNIPHVCCARNDDSLILRPYTGDDEGLHDKSFSAPSAVSTDAFRENDDGSIIYKSANSLLPKTNECGREKIENRIYSGQVSFCFATCFVLRSPRWRIGVSSCVGDWHIRLKAKVSQFCVSCRMRRKRNFHGWRCWNIERVSWRFDSICCS